MKPPAHLTPPRLVSCFGMLLLLGGTSLRAAEPESAASIASRPPMGWNSFDAYDSRINEEQFRQTVDILAADFKPLGWEYVVVDYIWFNPAPGNWNNPGRRHGHPDLRLDAQGRPLDRLAMDDYGRVLPAVERFPSAAEGRGFQPLADYVHSRGLKFGIHIMRGIPRQAYFGNLPIWGTKLRARDIADTNSTCNWCNNMFGVDTTKPGAQEYYDSLLRLYASWEVDFIKADDMLYPQYHAGEIEALHQALVRCGRPMVLSLSPGEAPLGRAEHLRQHASMWRISADLWDEWEDVRRSFDLCNAWSPFAGPGHWPDADMLPLGQISLGDRPHGPERRSKLSWEEHTTLMTLWCMARSPLMMGGDLIASSPKSLSFLQNPEVIAVNQSSTGNRQVFKDESHAVWTATDPATDDRYLALFNLEDKMAEVTFKLDWAELRGQYRVRDLWARQDAGTVAGRITRQFGPHGAGLYRLTQE